MKNVLRISHICNMGCFIVIIIFKVIILWTFKSFGNQNSSKLVDLGFAELHELLHNPVVLSNNPKWSAFFITQRRLSPQMASCFESWYFRMIHCESNTFNRIQLHFYQNSGTNLCWVLRILFVFRDWQGCLPSPLMFNYAVVWKLGKAIAEYMCNSYIQHFQYQITLVWTVQMLTTLEIWV